MRRSGGSHCDTRYWEVGFEGIYAVLDSSICNDLIALLDAVLRAGVRIVQYRSKSGIDRGVLSHLSRRARDAGAVLIVNDDLDAACEADGLHVGQEDLALFAGVHLRERLGRRILGISCATAAQALEAERLGADYVGVGPYNSTQSKNDAGSAIGERGVRVVARATSLPIAAIGGITVADLESVSRSGAKMAAIISAIAKPSHGDAESAARTLVAQWASMHRRVEAT
jgi:thiamine-phosphate pyrophosphorylase